MIPRATFLGAPYFAASIALAQVAGEVPGDVTASKTDGGITVTSKARGDEFSLTLLGRDIRPLSPERLKLGIDGRSIEIVTLHLGSDLIDKPDTTVLALYQHSVEQSSRHDGWQFVPASDATIALPDGKSALLWRMQKQPPDPAQPGGLTLAAALNRGNVVAVVG
jgi:hypothetical protein